MVVLDADSLMDGRTLAEMVRRMEANPRLGLLQTWPQVLAGDTLFARMQQFASWVYGRPLAFGMAALFGAQGNYWGHNAIIRIEAFVESCGLPMLPGKEPLGGEILSHDFVEAALLVRRGGRSVWLLTWEEALKKCQPICSKASCGIVGGVRAICNMVGCCWPRAFIRCPE